MTSDQKIAIVTGSSSGIGREISLTLAKNNFITYATMRNMQKILELKFISENKKIPLRFAQLDVTDDNSVKNAMETIYNESGKIDILVNNAGYGLTGAFEDLSIDEIKNQFETNVFGLIRMTQAVLPIMRKQKSGLIVNISSIGGRVGFPAVSAYVGTKFAVEGLSESISYEVEPFGIKVILIEPGAIKTNFFNSSASAKKSQDPNSPYISLMKGLEEGLKRMVESGTSPEYVAKIVLDVVTNTNDPKLRYLAGKDAEQLIESKNKLPDKEFQDMIKQM
ncbi:MAG TPA: SDR family oxidoreductase [Candidatus Nitrosocosmicus sp.]